MKHITEKLKTGNLGEDMACKYIIKLGYRIVERNYKKPWGEIDIIAIAPDKTLIFFEIKTMRQCGNRQSASWRIAGLTPEDQMTYAKMNKFKRTAQLFAGNHQELTNDKAGWRLDLLAIKFCDIYENTKIDGGFNSNPGVTILNDDEKIWFIRHYKNIF